MESEVIAALISTPVGGVVGYLAARATRGAGRDQADGSRDAAQIASSAQHAQWEREQRLTAAQALAEAAHAFLAAARTAKRTASSDGEAAQDVYISVAQALDALERHATAVAVPGPADVARAAQDVYARATQALTALLRQDATHAHAQAAGALHRVFAALSDFEDRTAELTELAEQALTHLGKAHARIDAAYALGLIDEDSATRSLLHSATVTVAAARSITRTATVAAAESDEALDDAEAAVTYAAAAACNALRHAIGTTVGTAWVRMQDNVIEVNGSPDPIRAAHDAIRSADGPSDPDEFADTAERLSTQTGQAAAVPILEAARNPATVPAHAVRAVQAQAAALFNAPSPEPYPDEPVSVAVTRGRRRTASMVEPNQAPAAAAYAIERLGHACASALAHQWSHHAARTLDEAIAADPAAAPLGILAGELAERLEQTHNRRRSELPDISEIFVTALTGMSRLVRAATISPDAVSLFNYLRPLCPYSQHIGDQNFLYPIGAAHIERIRLENIDLMDGNHRRVNKPAEIAASHAFGVLIGVAAWPDSESFWRSGSGDGLSELLEPVYDYDYAAAAEFERELRPIGPTSDMWDIPDGWHSLLDRVALTLRSMLLDQAYEVITNQVCMPVVRLADTGTDLRDGIARVTEADSGNDVVNVARLFAAQASAQADTAIERAGVAIREVDQARRAFLSYAAAHLGPNAIDLGQR
ncbi:hypothetical protein [Streptomyces mirabilis]|uniref:hypothetical protein n=1 Tax=Streptomyces mirabilis TaxID=68239 RepID=UPI0036D81CD7